MMIARLAMFLCLMAAIGVTGNALWQNRKADESRQQSDAASVRATGLIDASPKRLASKFRDDNHTLLADAPDDASKLMDPTTLILGHLASSDPDSASISWEDFDKHLSSELGRPVTDTVVENGPSQIDKIKAGQITIMALHAADAPFLVNNCGYHPVAVLGDETGAAGNRLDLIVPAKSTIASPYDLKGHTLTCTGPLSVVGYRAAIVLLLQNQSLRPNVDYLLSWSLGQKQSIKGVADGTYEAAAVSDDKLNSLLDKGTVTKAAYKVIYQSDVFPRTTIGYFYNLKPDLAEKLRLAILSYRPVPTDENDKPMHFMPVDYKKDFSLIRQIDDRFDPRLDTKAKHEVATTAP